MNHSHIKTIALNIFGGLGYLSAALQWLWASALYLPLLLESGAVQYLAERAPATPPVQPVVDGPPSLWQLIFGAAIAAIFIIITVILAAKLPGAISRGGHKLTQTTANTIQPVVSRHMPTAPNKRVRLNGQIIFLIKIFINLLPFVASLAAISFAGSISAEIIATISLFLYAWTLTFFSLQAILAKLFKVPYHKLR